MKESIQILLSLRNKNGLFGASSKLVKTGYHLAWLRDNVYEAMGLEIFDKNEAVKTFHAILDILLKHEYKIDWAIKEKPNAGYKYIHARYNPETLNEIYEEWGNKQNDAIGAILFKIGDLENKNISVLRNINDYRILQKLVFYLGKLEYWQDKDNGMWEENEEIHASSIGACVAGLIQIKNLIYVPEDYISKGKEALNNLLPKESITKECDLALLSLIYPYNICNESQKKQILENVEKLLLKKNGVIRYIGDKYYYNSGEAEWCFGLPWLSIINYNEGNIKKAREYLNKTLNVINQKGEVPELYFSNTNNYNDNTPLGWAQAMFIIANHNFNKEYQ